MYLIITINIKITTIKTNNITKNIQKTKIFNYKQLSSQHPYITITTPPTQLQL